MKSLFCDRNDGSPKFSPWLGNSTRKVGEYTLFDIFPMKEVASGQVCRAWWPCYWTAPANPMDSELFIQILTHRKSNVRRSAIQLKNHVSGVVSKLEKGKLAKHSFVVLYCDTLVSIEKRANDTFFTNGTPDHNRIWSLQYLAYLSRTFGSQIRQFCLLSTPNKKKLNSLEKMTFLGITHHTHVLKDNFKKWTQVCLSWWLSWVHIRN